MVTLPDVMWRQPSHKIPITHQQQENNENNGTKAN